MSFIAGAGAVNVDLLYNNIRRIPAVGEEIFTDDFSVQLGGGLPGTLLHLARLGIPVRLACELGEDMFSAFAEAEFRKAGITPLNLYRGGEIPVTVTSVMVLDGDRSFLSFGKDGLDRSADAEEQFYRLATGAKICYMEYNGFLNAYKKLKDEGTLLMFDTGWSDDLSIEKLADYLTLANYYAPNRKEAKKITGASDEASAAMILNRYLDKVIIKLDRDGCLGYDGSFFTVPAYDEYRCVDATGAGDAFLAGFMYGLYYGYSFKDCIRLGNRAGGKAVSEVGAVKAVLTEKELTENL